MAFKIAPNTEFSKEIILNESQRDIATPMFTAPSFTKAKK
jgi:hypothetical protein